MLLTSIVSTVLLAGAALAQTPTGFLPSVNKTLDVYFGTTYVTPGLMMKKSGECRQSWASGAVEG